MKLKSRMSSSDEDEGFQHKSSNLHLKSVSNGRPKVSKISIFVEIVRKIRKNT